MCVRWDCAARLQAALLRLYKDVLAPYWAPGRRHVDACYRGIEPGSEHFETVEWRQLSMQYTQTVSQLVGGCVV